MSIKFKFKSQKTYDSIECGAFLSVSEAKICIVEKRGLGKDPNFDLVLTNEATKEDYVTETALIPKNSTLIVRRVPVIARKRGKFEQTQKRRGSQVAAPTGGSNIGNVPQHLSLPQGGVASILTGGGEEQRINALMSQGPGWSKDDPVANQPRFMRFQTSKAPPENYICHRCQKSGHWINQCPTNGDPNFDFKTLKKATGIPKSFLQTVADTQVGTADGAMAIPGGGFAIVRPNNTSFNLVTEADIGEIPEDLQCKVCSELLANALEAPCCKALFCDKCIRQTLLKTGFACPSCRKAGLRPDSLVPAKEVRSKVISFKQDALASARRDLERRAVEENLERMRAHQEMLGEGADDQKAPDGASSSSLGSATPAVAGSVSSSSSSSSRSSHSSSRREDAPDFQEVTETKTIKGLEVVTRTRGRFIDTYVAGEKVCRDFAQAPHSCRFGTRCHYLHPKEIEEDYYEKNPNANKNDSHSSTRRRRSPDRRDRDRGRNGSSSSSSSNNHRSSHRSSRRGRSRSPSSRSRSSSRGGRDRDREKRRRY